MPDRKIRLFIGYPFSTPLSRDGGMLFGVGLYGRDLFSAEIPETNLRVNALKQNRSRHDEP